MTTLVLKPNYMTNNYYKLEKRNKHIYTLTSYKKNTPPFQFVCPLFHFGMSQNIVLFLKLKTINLLMFLLCLYFISKTIFDKFWKLIHFYTANKTINDIFLKNWIFETRQTNQDRRSTFFIKILQKEIVCHLFFSWIFGIER